MKKLLFLLLIILTAAPSFAGHIAGGEIYYTNLGPGQTPNTDRYKITLRLFRECFPPQGGQPTADLPVEVWMAVYNRTTPATQYGSTHIVGIDGPKQKLQMTSPNPCITNPPVVCYEVGTFTFTVDLPVTPNGYTISFQTCCRTNGISNIAGSGVGATYTAEIPPSVLPTDKNSSAVFSLKDTTLVCKNSNFMLDFSATDADGDSLSYAFCNAYNGGNTTNSANVTPSLPPYGSITYSAGFSGSSPLGSQVTINPATGMISGTSPGAGSYVVTVCVSEWRNGRLISIHRKDFTLKIGDCTLSAAELKPDYITCDGYTMTFQNESTSAGNNSYTWNFGDPASGANNVSNLPTPTHTYSDTGIYTLKLKVENTVGCRDSATALVRVYPGFFPEFDVIGSCFQTPFQFLDRTTTNHGVVSSWRWDFGDLSTTADTSRLRNPNYQYPNSGPRTATLIVGNSKGCIDTITRPVVVNDIPLLQLPFKDTLICSIDTLPLIAIGNGDFSWTPTTNMIGSNTSNPLVFPKDTTRYIVTLNENGCIKKDTIMVNVLDFITVELGPDTAICLTDSLRFNTVSHALGYVWTPTDGLSDPGVKHPMAAPLTTTKYHVKANLGKCPHEDSITVYVVPYPQASVGPDVEICYGDRVPLTANIVGSSFTWTPSNSLMNPNTLTPVAGPMQTTSYVIAAYDTLGCPKPYRDTVVVTVRPRVQAFAGRDTVVVANQPLQLTATGGASYLWSPTIGMNNPTIANPIVTLGPNIDSVRYLVRVTTTEGCFEDDDVKVYVFKTPPDIFVPSAFTPNRDGKNDILRPKPVGIRLFYYFRVFNRWGQLVYSTSDIGAGWDGTLNGKDQGSGTYVYMTEGVDYTGKPVFRKGTVVLIR
ncbi:PKD domain-containing protein [Aridibaculum aurantiacum]|uniref:PKD domain-containing protein n=1 Tax=Aridibaculum aurantiacum TaxID=2810307 RepID=UPI001A96A0C4|nr:PKD domain-containing protein [Aridibaculum aurantiacum]